jgi:hypothetical protein
VIAALIVDGIFGLAGLIPSERPTADDVFGEIGLDYKLALNVIAAIVFVVLMYLTLRPSPDATGDARLAGATAQSR